MAVATAYAIGMFNDYQTAPGTNLSIALNYQLGIDNGSISNGKGRTVSVAIPDRIIVVNVISGMDCIAIDKPIAVCERVSIYPFAGVDFIGCSLCGRAYGGIID
jgi:hypothetical protein